jgi:MSHA biogenesis protein MshN
MGIARMSIINQVLLDLDKRRASGADRSALPDHVRALPEVREGPRKWLIAAISGIAVAALAAWAVTSGFALQPGKKLINAIAEVKLAEGDKIIQGAAKPESVPNSQPREKNDAIPEALEQTLLLGRLSLELSNPPVAVPESAQQLSQTRVATKAPIETALVLGKPRPERGAKSAPESAVPSSVAPMNTPRAPSAGTDTVNKVPAATAKQPTKLAQAAMPEIQKNVIKSTPLQLAEQEYGKASTLLYKGKRDEARAALEAALQHYPGHMGARQGLFGMMVEDKNYAAAEQIMVDGLQHNPAQIGFAMPLARLQLDQGNMQAAVDTLKKNLGYAQNNPDYLAFLAALLQRQKRHGEAIDQYAAALKLKPQSGVWLMGLGISLQAVDRNAEAQEVYRRAKASGNLNPDLQAYVDQRLRQMK